MTRKDRGLRVESFYSECKNFLSRQDQRDRRRHLHILLRGCKEDSQQIWRALLSGHHWGNLQWSILSFMILMITIRILMIIMTMMLLKTKMANILSDCRATSPGVVQSGKMAHCPSPRRTPCLFFSRGKAPFHPWKRCKHPLFIIIHGK